MVKCASCNKEIEKLPVWLESVPVKFICNNCPNRAQKPTPQRHTESAAVKEPKLPADMLEGESDVELSETEEA